MDSKIEPITLKNFEDLPSFRLFPYSCRFCAFWESPDFCETTRKEDAEQTKRDWFVRVRKEFGDSGFIVYVDKAPVGIAEYAPTKYFPTASKYKAGIPCGDAIFLACLYIARRDLRGKGIGKQLLGEVLRDIRDRGGKAVETIAFITDPPSDTIEGWYVGDSEFFLRNGFIVKSQENGIALLRRELVG